MQLDGQHLRSEKLIHYYLALSILRNEMLVITSPSEELLELVRLVAPIVKADVKGAGVDSTECIFVPSKLAKLIEVDMQGTSPLPLLQTMMPVFLFCGHHIKITLSNCSREPLSIYYMRDVLLSHLSRYLETSSCHIEQQGTVTLQLKGKYDLETAPPLITRKQPELIAIRGEAQLNEESLYSYLALGLKDFGVTVRLHRVYAQQRPLIHLNALYGGEEGYDNDFAYILYDELQNTESLTDIETFLLRFKKLLKEPQLSQTLIEDLLLYVGLLGGQLPTNYEETDFLLDELNKELEGEIRPVNGRYILDTP